MECYSVIYHPESTKRSLVLLNADEESNCSGQYWERFRRCSYPKRASKRHVGEQLWAEYLDSATVGWLWGSALGCNTGFWGAFLSWDHHLYPRPCGRVTARQRSFIELWRHPVWAPAGGGGFYLPTEHHLIVSLIILSLIFPLLPYCLCILFFSHFYPIILLLSFTVPFPIQAVYYSASKQLVLHIHVAFITMLTLIIIVSHFII